MRDVTKDQGNVKRREQIKQVRYVKTYKTFGEGMNEVVQLSEKVRNLLEDIKYQDGEDPIQIREIDYNSIKDVKEALLLLMDIYLPSLEERKNIHFDLSMSANKCSLKTDRYISFGWFIKRRADNYNTFEYVFHIILFGEKEDLSPSLLENGWIVDPYRK